MDQREIDALRGLTNLEDLLDYLRDRLDWPLEADDVEDLTFEYEPDELGLAPEHAVKVESIKQLRPLSDDQPWGIFYVQFEAKRLPIVVMRRILRGLTPSRSHSANQPTWQRRDLLFISSFGEATQREMAFAHFHKGDSDLPTLRVLGWDGADTALRLDHVAQRLHECLTWPDDPEDTDA